ncbi:MAG: hypothetical protein KKA07_15260 [Bacteroidetes bacterium]|nr:hypothetical protein [Bacteroidota bacterium]MBU1720420.1 hypothetical protein [Bacteroidota bacterium]
MKRAVPIILSLVFIALMSQGCGLFRKKGCEDCPHWSHKGAIKESPAHHGEFVQRRSV